MYLSQLPHYFSKLHNVFVRIDKFICPNCRMHLFKFQNVFVQNEKCIASIQITKLICPNCVLVFLLIFFVQLNFCINNFISGLILSLASVLGFDCKTCRSISLNMNKEGESSIEMIHKSPEHGTLMELPGRKTSLTSYPYSPISHSDNFQTTVAHDHIFVLNDAL